MRFDSAPIEGRLVRRYKRFLADVELPGGETIVTHCPNTGSLLGCKEPGSRVWLRDSGNPKRKLRYTWQAIRVGRTWVNVDTNLPNRVVAEAVAEAAVPELEGYAEQRREVPYGRSSRIDLKLGGPGRRDCYVEVKSTTLTDGGVGLFPDAVTERGRKHLEELIGVMHAGGRAVQFFLINRDDVDSFRPADSIDPEYGSALRRAAAAGVELMAWTTRLRAKSFELARSIPIDLPQAVRVAVKPRRRKA